ncbi:MAG TPA: FG-GAP-like repeat-containing protein [bacterium]|nr:FG-GAP-like repeat-containing protein [bacterium]
MKKLLMVFCLLLAAVLVTAQDLTQYELLNSATVGIPKVLMDRWGAVSADIDNNGWPDIFSVKWRGRTIYSQIYLNSSGMYGNDIMPNSPQLMAYEDTQNATRCNIFADYDNDGDKDFFYGGDYDMALFRNDNNVFTNVSQATGVKGAGAPGFFTVYGFDCGAWADYDRDGDLDLVVCQTNNKNFFFFRNNGGVFENIAQQVGLAGKNPLGNTGDRGAYSARLQWIDYDLDGDPDLSAGWLLFQNDNGVFTEVAKTIGLKPDSLTFFTAWFDYDTDGDWDFFKIRHGSEDPGHNSIWQNQNGTFVDVTDETGLNGWNPHIGASFNIGDYDNDGDEDVYIQINNWTDMDVLLLNEEVEGGLHVLTDVAPYVGMTTVGDRKGATMLDYDMDGFLDIYVPSLDFGSLIYHNKGNANHWIGMILEGVQSNRDAIGALVTCYADGKKQMRYTRVPSTWKTQDNQFILFGIGAATAVDSIIIRWPLGLKEVYTDLAIDQYHRIKEGQGSSEVAAKPVAAPETFYLEQNHPNPFNPTTTIRYQVFEASPVTLTIFNLRGERVQTLVNAEFKPAGSYSLSWNGKDQEGRSVPSGIYLYRLEAGGTQQVKKMTCMK